MVGYNDALELICVWLYPLYLAIEMYNLLSPCFVFILYSPVPI